MSNIGLLRAMLGQQSMWSPSVPMEGEVGIEDVKIVWKSWIDGRSSLDTDLCDAQARALQTLLKGFNKRALRKVMMDTNL